MSLPLQEHIEKDGFRLRGLGMSRIDAFSDVVFGFALTLLVVSLEVPKTYSELHHSLRGIIPFAICFLFLMMIWHAHYKFFRRFGTHDIWTIILNSMLLFVVLFFVYPLKFLFTFVVAAFTGGSNAFNSYRELAELMVLYGMGFTAIYVLIGALYWNGYRQRRQLGLNRVEEILTRSYIGDSIGVVGIGVLACAVAVLLPPQLSGLSGWTYMLISVFKTIHGRQTRKRVERQQALEKLTSAAQ